MSTVQENRGMAPVIASSTIGTAIEWYDFFLYGTMATLVFPRIFFPESNAIVGQLLALFTFLVGFIARPFGGAFFGHLGDRIGRKSTLVSTLLLMGISTLLIGFLPGYTAIGVAAPLILVILRLGQGLGVGGEWGGSVLLALEYGHKSKRGFWASWPQMGVPIGLILSTIVVNIVQASSGEGFFTFGWRIPFFISALLIIIGLYIRLSIMETPLFRNVKEQNREAKSPILDAFRYSTPEILLSAGARFVRAGSVLPLHYLCDYLCPRSEVAIQQNVYSERYYDSSRRRTLHDSTFRLSLRLCWETNMVSDWLCPDGGLCLPILPADK